MAEVIQFKTPLYMAKQFTAQIGVHQWQFSGTLCGCVDMATSAGTFCLTRDEVLGVIKALQDSFNDVTNNSKPHNDPRIVERT